MRTSAVTVEKVGSYANRDEALTVIEQVYRNEKGWIREVETEIAADAADLATSGIQSWYLAKVNGEPAGVIRLVYDPPLSLQAEYGVELEPAVDLEGLAKTGRFVTHQTGELACESVRILLILDIARAYQRLKRRQRRVFRELGASLADLLEGRARPRPA